jgi:membrane protease YdiL (CAAX protease family)
MSALRHAFVALSWLLSYRLVADYGVHALPLSVARHLTLPEYLGLVAIVVTTAGLAATFLIVDDPRGVLGLSPPSAGALGRALLWAAPLFVVASAVAIAIALPTLLSELREAGRQAVQKQTGEFGRSLVAAPLLVALGWGVVLSPIAEELLFRGALWSLIQRAADHFAPGQQAPTSAVLPSGVLAPSRTLGALRAIRSFVLAGGFATLVSAAVFAAMHADTPGGLGIVRVMSAFGLGIGTGLARHKTGALWAPMVLHMGFNLLSLATTRRWVVTATLPLKYGVPTSLVLAGAVCLLVLLGIRLARK